MATTTRIARTMMMAMAQPGKTVIGADEGTDEGRAACSAGQENILVLIITITTYYI